MASPQWNSTPQQSRRLRSSYASTIVSITLVLFILGLMATLLLNVSRLSRYVKENVGFSIEFADNVSDADVAWVRKQLDIAPFVRETRFISKDEAERELRYMLGADFVSFLGYNPLPVSIEAKLRYQYAHPDSLQYIEKRLAAMPQVKEVIYQKSLIELVSSNVNRISAILLLFSVLLFVVSLAQINNTIRLSIYSRRFIIYTMKLVGATRAFIIRPFLARSALHGVIAAFAAFLLLSGMFVLVRNQMDFGSVSLFSMDIVGLLMLCLLLLGLLVSMISTFFAVDKFLDLNADELHY
ncbi:cell division protein FtsX [Bacteroidia bacterium]|nr:cell division protein FtsX [Bacteroidia bacterium]